MNQAQVTLSIEAQCGLSSEQIGQILTHEVIAPTRRKAAVSGPPQETDDVGLSGQEGRIELLSPCQL